MAVYRYYRRCDVCGSVTLVRVQAGHLPEYPVRVYCGNCEIMFSGRVQFNEDEASARLELNNCSSVGKDEPPSYTIEVSGELPTTKLHKSASGLNTRNVISPFIRMTMTLGHEKNEQYTRIIRFMRTLSQDWPIHRRIYELYFNGKRELLKNEILKIGFVVPNRLESEIDYTVSVHQILVRFLSTPLNIANFFEDAETIRLKTAELFSELDREKNENIKDFIKYIGEPGFVKMEGKIFKSIETFIEKFQYIVPGFILFFFDEGKTPSHEELGVTTAVFEDLKSFYIDTYEIMMDHIEILIGFNNLIHRKSYENMKSHRTDVIKINQLRGIPNGKKIEFIDGTETLDYLIFSKFDHSLRNAMSHSSTSYNGIEQIITYFPKGKEEQGKGKDIYLIEFIQKCIIQFSALMNIWELLYTMKKMKHTYDGEKLSVIQSYSTPSKVDSVSSLSKRSTKTRFTTKNKRKQQKESRKMNRK